MNVRFTVVSLLFLNVGSCELVVLQDVTYSHGVILYFQSTATFIELVSS